MTTAANGNGHAHAAPDAGAAAPAPKKPWRDNEKDPNSLRAIIRANFPTSIDDAFPPKYTKLELVMGDGTRLAYCDPRRFGRVKLRGAEPEELAALAPDALTPPAVASMRQTLGGKSAPIKAVLLDQSAVVCGIGLCGNQTVR